MSGLGERGSPGAAVPAVRVVVVTFHSGEVLGGFLGSLPKATDRPYEVVVVDNSPELDEGTTAAATRPEVRLLPTGANLGYGTAANRGAAGATADWLLVANPDVLFRPGTLDTLIDAAGRWPRAGSFGPALVTDGVLYPSARELPSLRRGIGHALLGWWWPSNPWTAGYRNERGEPREGPAGWLSGACLLVRREAFEAVGGFDESYFMFLEDVDLCRRLGEAGWPSVYVPSSVVTHLLGHATRRVSRQMLRAHHESMFRYLSRQYADWRWAPVRLVLRVGLTARLLLAMVSRRAGEGAAPTRSADLLADTTRRAG